MDRRTDGRDVRAEADAHGAHASAANGTRLPRFGCGYFGEAAHGFFTVDRRPKRLGAETNGWPRTVSSPSSGSRGHLLCVRAGATLRSAAKVTASPRRRGSLSIARLSPDMPQGEVLWRPDDAGDRWFRIDYGRVSCEAPDGRRVEVAAGNERARPHIMEVHVPLAAEMTALLARFVLE